MDKLFIDNNQFDINIGIRVLKMKFPDGLPDHFPDTMKKDWDKVEPLTFKDIATKITNVEQRRIAILYLGLEKMIEQVEPRLIAKESVEKETIWVNSNGELENVKFDDVYELHAVTTQKLFDNSEIHASRLDRLRDVHFIKCKDTSTDRVYHIWVDLISVADTNDIPASSWDLSYIEKINPIMAIAWTITTNVAIGSIEKIIRQGDCILVKKKPNAVLLDNFRHLTEKEYRTLLVNES